MEIIVCGRV